MNKEWNSCLKLYFWLLNSPSGTRFSLEIPPWGMTSVLLMKVFLTSIQDVAEEHFGVEILCHPSPSLSFLLSAKLDFLEQKEKAQKVKQDSHRMVCYSSAVCWPWGSSLTGTGEARECVYLGTGVCRQHQVFIAFSSDDGCGKEHFYLEPGRLSLGHLIGSILIDTGVFRGTWVFPPQILSPSSQVRWAVCTLLSNPDMLVCKASGLDLSWVCDSRSVVSSALQPQGL